MAQISGTTYTRLASVADSSISETPNSPISLELLIGSNAAGTGAMLVTPAGITNLSVAGSFLGQNVGVGARMANSQFDCFMVETSS